MEAIIFFGPGIADAPWRPEREAVIGNALCEAPGMHGHFVLRGLGSSDVLQLTLFENASVLQLASGVIVQALGLLPRVHVPGHFREICHVLEWDEVTDVEPRYARVRAFGGRHTGRNQSFQPFPQTCAGGTFAGAGLLQGPDRRFRVGLWASFAASGAAPAETGAPPPSGSYEVEAYLRPLTVMEV